MRFTREAAKRRGAADSPSVIVSMKPFRPPFRTGRRKTNATTAWSLKMFVNEKGVGRSTAIMYSQSRDEILL